MANSTTLQAIITLRDEATAKIRAINEEIGRLKADTQDNFKNISSELQKFGVGLTAVGVGTGALLVNTTIYAARVQVLGTVMENVGRVAGVSSDYLYQQQDAIKFLGITTESAREMLIRFMQSELDLADAAKIARVAQDLAVISGQNSSEAAETLTQAIVSQQPQLLKQFNIVQNLDDIYGNYAKTLGKSAQDLTEVDKKQAFLNTILDRGEKVAGTYEVAMGKVGKQMTSMPRLVDEARLAFGEALLPVMGLVIESASDLLKAYQALSPETKRFITYAVALSSAFAVVAGSFMIFIGLLPGLITLLASVSVALGVTVAGLGFVTAGVIALIAVVAYLIAHWKELEGVQYQLSVSMLKLHYWFAELRADADDMIRLRGAIAEAESELNKWAESQVPAAKKVDKVTEAIRKAKEGVEEMTEAMKKAAEKMKSAFESFAKTVVSKFSDQIDKIRDLRKEMAALTEETEESLNRSKEQYRQDLVEKARSSKEKIDQIDKEISDTAKAMNKGWRGRISELEEEKRKEKEIIERVRLEVGNVNAEISKDELTNLQEKHKKELEEIQAQGKKKVLEKEKEALELEVAKTAAAVEVLKPGGIERLVEAEARAKPWEIPPSQTIFNIIFNGDVNDKDTFLKMIIDALNRTATLKGVAGQ